MPKYKLEIELTESQVDDLFQCIQAKIVSTNMLIIDYLSKKVDDPDNPDKYDPFIEHLKSAIERYENFEILLGSCLEQV